MGQKDLTAKDLESRPEVFADIINALIYEGEQIVSPEQLRPASTETLYEGKAEDLNSEARWPGSQGVCRQYKVTCVFNGTSAQKSQTAV